jgi:hypothetical protein
VLDAINEIETDYGRDLERLERRGRELDAVPAGGVRPHPMSQNLTAGSL